MLTDSFRVFRGENLLYNLFAIFDGVLQVGESSISSNRNFSEQPFQPFTFFKMFFDLCIDTFIFLVFLSDLTNKPLIFRDLFIEEEMLQINFFAKDINHHFIKLSQKPCYEIDICSLHIFCDLELFSAFPNLLKNPFTNFS